jgi:hypothetical protein
MPRTSVTDKQRRAAAFGPRPGPTPQTGRLDVRWASAFDRACFLVSTQGLRARHCDAYNTLIQNLRAGTGCTEAEILAHGNKVRSVITYAEDRLHRAGALGHLSGKQKHLYELPAVRPAF